MTAPWPSVTAPSNRKTASPTEAVKMIIFVISVLKHPITSHLPLTELLLVGRRKDAPPQINRTCLYELFVRAMEPHNRQSVS
jgi:hypothetical protein